VKQGKPRKTDQDRDPQGPKHQGRKRQGKKKKGLHSRGQAPKSRASGSSSRGAGGLPGGNVSRNRRKSRKKKKGGFSRNGHSPGKPHEKIDPDIPLETVEGVLEILPDGYGFLRRLEFAYQPEEDDVFVPAAMIRDQLLKEGSMIKGQAGVGRGKSKGRQLAEAELADGVALDEYRERVPFNRLTSIDPLDRLRIDESGDTSMRILDLVAPVGKGQRGLIVAAPRTGKTMILQKLAQSIAKSHTDVHLMIVLIDERPEEVTEMKRSTQAEVIASSSDEMARKHVRVAEIVLERARRLVEGKTDVVILLDSLTRMARAYNVENRGSGRTLSGGLDAKTMQKPREFFGAARNAEEGGSLTIIATALIDTGSRMDQVIFEEFKGTGNMEVILHQPLADRRVWPAIDIHRSGTRKEEKLRTPDTQDQVNLLRRILADRKVEGAMEALISKITKTENNTEFLDLLTIPR